MKIACLVAQPSVGSGRYSSEKGKTVPAQHDIPALRILEDQKASGSKTLSRSCICQLLWPAPENMRQLKCIKFLVRKYKTPLFHPGFPNLLWTPLISMQTTRTRDGKLARIIAIFKCAITTCSACQMDYLPKNARPRKNVCTHACVRAFVMQGEREIQLDQGMWALALQMRLTSFLVSELFDSYESSKSALAHSALSEFSSMYRPVGFIPLVWIDRTVAHLVLTGMGDCNQWGPQPV
jgi:hypothetical protein